VSEEVIKKVKEIVNQAVEFQRKGKGEEALRLITEAELKAIGFLGSGALGNEDTKSLIGLIRHCEGRILQAMGKYDEAEEKFRNALELRKDDPVGYGYSKFQLFILKDYAGMSISPREVRDTKMVIWEWADATKDPRELGDVFQNLAYIEQRRGDVQKAIWFYQVAEVFRGIASDQRGFALTSARLGECYAKIGEIEKAREYGEKALKYFEERGDIERIQQVKKNVFGEKK